MRYNTPGECAHIEQRKKEAELLKRERIGKMPVRKFKEYLLKKLNRKHN